jgi:hypothetical protein
MRRFSGKSLKKEPKMVAQDINTTEPARKAKIRDHNIKSYTVD